MDGTNPASAWGYIPYGDEYRYGRNAITGAFNSDYTSALDVWHLAQDFAAAPTLNSAFIQQANPLDRVVAVSSEHHLRMDCFFKETWVRCMPTYAVPGLLDHF